MRLKRSKRLVFVWSGRHFAQFGTLEATWSFCKPGELPKRYCRVPGLLCMIIHVANDLECWAVVAAPRDASPCPAAWRAILIDLVLLHNYYACFPYPSQSYLSTVLRPARSTFALCREAYTWVWLGAASEIQGWLPSSLTSFQSRRSQCFLNKYGFAATAVFLCARIATDRWTGFDVALAKDWIHNVRLDIKRGGHNEVVIA